MRKTLVISIAAAFLFFGAAVFAETKIGVINFNKILLDSPQLAAAKADLKKRFEGREKEMTELQRKFQKEIEDFNKNGPTMKSEDQKKAQQKIIDQQKKLQQLQGKFQEDLGNAQNKAMKSIVEKVESIVNSIGSKEKYDLILTNASTAYSKKEFDITNKVIAQMKK